MSLYDRMIYQNKYTRLQIQAKTKMKPENNSIICVGNNSQRRKLEQKILTNEPCVISGDPMIGKMTSVLEICDKHDLIPHISYDGKDFEDEPLDNDEVYIIRFKKTSKWIKLYMESDCKVILIVEGKLPKFNCTFIKYGQISGKHRADYLNRKGSELKNYKKAGELSVRNLITKMLRQGISSEEMPKNVEQWLSVNFSGNKKLLKMCSYLSSIEDNVFKHSMLNKIRYKKTISLKYPPWVKKETKE